MIKKDIKIPIRCIEYTVYTSTLTLYLGEVVRQEMDIKMPIRVQ
jgi:hypothetical protein